MKMSREYIRDIICNNHYKHSHYFCNLLVHTHHANPAVRAVTPVATCLVQTALQNNFDSESWTC